MTNVIGSRSNTLCYKTKINRLLYYLIVAIIRSAADVTRIGEPTFLNHFQQVLLISEFILTCVQLCDG